MHMWWPRAFPYIGTTWVYSTRYGEISPHITAWEVHVFVLSWFDYAVIVYQFGLPRKVDDDNCS